jgi:hypothetical protein
MMKTECVDLTRRVVSTLTICARRVRAADDDQTAGAIERLVDELLARAGDRRPN